MAHLLIRPVRVFSLLESVKKSFSSSKRLYSSTREKINLTFIGKLDEKIKLEAFVGESLLDVSQRCGLDVEGACEGSMACSTCHMIFTPETYALLPKITEDENDTLELAAV